MASMSLPETPAPRLPDGWAATLGLEITHVSADEIRAEWTVDGRHLQPFGIVHGGVHASVVETLCSMGAAESARRDGLVVVGLENHTSFLRAVRSGRLRAVARPVHAGRRAQLWRTEITDEKGRLVATGTVRLLALDPAAAGAGGGE